MVLKNQDQAALLQELGLMREVDTPELINNREQVWVDVAEVRNTLKETNLQPIRHRPGQTHYSYQTIISYFFSFIQLIRHYQ